MFRHNPKLPTYTSVSDGSASSLAALSADRFEKCISRPHKPDCEQQLNRRIEKILLQEMNNATLHYSLVLFGTIFATILAIACGSVSPAVPSSV